MSAFGPAYSVGTINMVLKVIVLSTVALAAELISHCFRLLTGLRLAKDGKAPFSFASDGEVFKIFKTLKRLWLTSCPGLLAVSLLAFAIFPAEIATDFGVKASEFCAPALMQTHGICSMRISVYNSFSKQLATALLVEDLKWDHSDLVSEPIRQGFRKDSDGSEYLGPSVERNESLPIVVENCYSEGHQLIPEGNLTFGGSRLMKGEGAALLRVDTPGKSYIGQGGVFNNYEVSSSFLVVEHANEQNDSSSATIIEYHNSAHLQDIMQNSDGSPKDWYASRIPARLTAKARAPLLTYKVGCGQTSLNGEKFSIGIFAYRYAQLARSAKRNRLPIQSISRKGLRVFAPMPLDAANVVRATIASKITEAVSCEGETFLFQKCGYFDMKMGFPLILVTSILFVLYVALQIRKRISRNVVKTPLSESAWARFALKLCSRERITCVIGSDEYDREYKQHGERPVMGEFVKTNRGDNFFLRHITFAPTPDYLHDFPPTRANSIPRANSRPQSRYTTEAETHIRHRAFQQRSTSH